MSINVDHVKFGTYVESPDGRRYYVSDGDSDDRGSYLWIKGEGATRRRRLYQDQADAGWTQTSEPATPPALASSMPPAPFASGDAVTYQGCPLVVVRLNEPGDYVEMAFPEWDGTASRDRGIWAPVGKVKARTPGAGSPLTLPNSDDSEEWAEYRAEQCRACGAMGPWVNPDDQTPDPNDMWGYHHLLNNAGHNRVYVWTITRANGKNIVF
jgi:hypothetical protein